MRGGVLRMDKESIMKEIKEKAPTLLVGAMIGAVVVTAFVNQEKISNTLKSALGRFFERGKQ